ncbi:hypothetical protein IGI37_003816 [Enterococcus sp. AZ194]|uniref:hypothetical protein n=1 Tax=Enterococcus sp. AZ194 TaxID=2774629 RepID=UPI003F246B7D
MKRLEMVEDYFEDVNIFYILFKDKGKNFERTMIVPYLWAEKEVLNYLKKSFPQVEITKISLIDEDAWMPKIY